MRMSNLDRQLARQNRPRGPMVPGKTRPYEDMTGLRFGLWLVLSKGDIRAGRNVRWLCQCECGTTAFVFASSLKDTESGGCRTCKAGRQMRLATNRLWKYTRRHAFHRGIEFALDKEATFAILVSQNNRCALSGVPLNFALSALVHMHGGTTASLDRIDSTKGYVAGNVWWVHKDVNRMKSNLPLDRFLDLCACIIANQPSKPTI
jgi:hypothetical protein